MENLGTPTRTTGYGGNASLSRFGEGYGYGDRFRTGLAAGAGQEAGAYSYEDEDQSPALPGRVPARAPYAGVRATPYPAAKQPDSLDNIAQFFSGRPGGGRAFARPKLEVPQATGAAGLKKGSRVRHGKYGEGTVILREGDGEDAKLTVHFARFGVKKLMEKFAQLERL